MKINGELGKVLSTSPEHRQWNCGMGIFKPGVVCVRTCIMSQAEP